MASRLLSELLWGATDFLTGSYYPKAFTRRKAAEKGDI